MAVLLKLKQRKPFGSGFATFILSVYVLCVIALAAASSEVSLPTYEDITTLGVSCFPQDTCQTGASRTTRDVEDHSQHRKCECDDQCAVYGDCCVDAKLVREMPRARQDWSCKYLTQFGSVYMKATCSSTWTDSEIAKNCTKPEEGDQQEKIEMSSENPLGSLPVTNNKTGVTYRNYYCATCNDDVDNLVFWKTRLECDFLPKYNETYKNLTVDYVAKNLVYNEEERSWGVWLYGGSPEKDFYACFNDPVVPSELEGRVRKCKNEVVSKCKKDWTDKDVIHKCDAYMATVAIGQTMYRNVHCALCNHENVSKAMCKEVEGRQEIFYRQPFNKNALSIIFDVNGRDGEIVGEITICVGNEVYDPFFKRCINIKCGFPGYRYDKGKCIKQESQDVSVSVYIGGTLPDLNDTIHTSRDGSGNFRNYVSPGNETNYSIPDPTDFETCPKVTLERDEYQRFDNGTIYVAKYQRIYNSSWYRIEGDDLIVCVHFLNNTDGRSAKFSAYLGYISVIGMAISIICLALHMIVFILVPELQNLSGRNLTSLVVALFSAYLCFIFGQLSFLSPVSCKVIAIFTYYFFLASFFWMNAMAFDVWRTLKMATTELRVSSGKQWHRFLAYSVYSWLMSAFIVMASIIVDYSDTVPSELRPSFGKYQCWFGHRKALLVFFAIPAGVIMAANVCLFISSARMIIMTTKTSIRNQSSAARNNYKLYLRLSVIMGLTWVVGFIAGYTDVEALWCIFVILNTLQGLFILIAFSFNRKVCNNIRDRFSSSRLPAYRTSSMNSASGSAFHSNSTIHTHLSRTITPQSPTNEEWKMSFH